MPDPVLCRCGHAADLHSHLRPGTDCASCMCPRFLPVTSGRVSPAEWRRMLAVVLGVPALVSASVGVGLWMGAGAVALLLVTAAVVALTLTTTPRDEPEHEEERP